MSGSGISSSSNFVILSIASNLNLVRSNNDLDLIYNFLSYLFKIFQTHRLIMERHILNTSRDNLSLFSFQIYSKH